VVLALALALRWGGGDATLLQRRVQSSLLEGRIALGLFCDGVLLASEVDYGALDSCLVRLPLTLVCRVAVGER
jgi:hypothetical protein